MVSPRKEPQRPPAPVAESWRRIELWLAEHLPEVRASLRPGVSAADLAAFEAETGLILPDDVCASWLIHDGQGAIPRSPEVRDDNNEDEDDEDDEDEEPGSPLLNGVLFGMELLPLFDAASSPTGKSVLSEWRFWVDLFDPDGPDETLNEGCTSSPAGAIRSAYTIRAWVPLHADESGSDHLGIDLDPGPEGVVGQVINFGRNQRTKYVLASSWAHFLEDVAEELEEGNFIIDDDSAVKGGGSRLRFQMARPNKGALAANYWEWSKAKANRHTELP